MHYNTPNISKLKAKSDNRKKNKKNEKQLIDSNGDEWQNASIKLGLNEESKKRIIDIKMVSDGENAISVVLFTLWTTFTI